jgi:hypothetical protein
MVIERLIPGDFDGGQDVFCLDCTAGDLIWLLGSLECHNVAIESETIDVARSQSKLVQLATNDAIRSNKSRQE